MDIREDYNKLFTVVIFFHEKKNIIIGIKFIAQPLKINN